MTARSYPNPPGRPPKPESQRRRRNTPKSYGAAQATTAHAASRVDARERGIDKPPPVIASVWDPVQQSCEAQFYSDADWVRLRLELFHANALMTGRRQLTPSAQSAVQAGLNEMLLSPAIKRRAGIELRPQAVDEDEVAAVSITGKYKTMLKSV